MVLATSSDEKREVTQFSPVTQCLTDPKLPRRNLVTDQYQREKTRVLQKDIFRNATNADGVKPSIIGNTPEKLVNASIRIIHQLSGDVTHVTSKYQDNRAI